MMVLVRGDRTGETVRRVAAALSLAGEEVAIAPWHAVELRDEGAFVHGRVRRVRRGIGFEVEVQPVMVDALLYLPGPRNALVDAGQRIAGMDLFLVFNREIHDDTIAAVVSLFQRHLDDAAQWYRDFRPAGLGGDFPHVQVQAVRAPLDRLPD